MLVIISDLHLTDGTSGETIREGAFQVFRERLRELAYHASWRADGKYKPIERLELVLLGDILDVIRSTKWLDEKPGELGYVRPWDDCLNRPFIDKVRSISDSILQTNANSLAILRSMKDPTVTTLPPATQEGKPAQVPWEPDAPGRVPVSVRIHYMVGNHDWFYHLPDPAYHDIRRAVVDALGLENASDRPFPHDPQEPAAELIRQVCEEHKVFARHGDRFDSFNYDGHRNVSSLGDAIVVELVDSFSATVKAQLGQELPAECIDGLKEIDNVRPLLLIPVWVDGLLRATCPDMRLQRKVKQIWDELADRLIHLPFVREHHAVFRLFDNVEKLRWALTFSKELFRDHLSRFLPWFDEKIGTRQGSYYPHALCEAAFKSRAARFIVYGHTHRPDLVPLDTVTSFSAGPAKQCYINSGTWRPVHVLTTLNTRAEKFIGYHTMTYLAFFKDDERGGRSFESWSGALGGTPDPAL